MNIVIELVEVQDFRENLPNIFRGIYRINPNFVKKNSSDLHS